MVSPDNSHRATVDMRSMQNRTCNAQFEKIPEHELEVGMSGGGAGSVISEPAGIDCTKTATGTEGTCVAPFEEGTEVTLFATPAPGSFFGGFSGNGTPGPDGAFVIPMNGPGSVDAEFFISFGLTVIVEGEGGRVTSDEGGIDCTEGGGTCVGFVREGNTVMLTAHPAEGWRFVGWDEEYTGGPITTSLLMDRPRTIRALFQRIIQYRIGMNFTGSGSGTVVSEPAGINCMKSGTTTSGACAADFDAGTQLRLTATPAEGSERGDWTGPGTTDTNGDRLVDVDGPKDVGAAFTVPPRLAVTPAISNDHRIEDSPCPHAVGNVTVRNTGTRVFDWTAALPAGETGFTLTRTSGTLAAGGIVQIGVFFTCNPQTTLTRAVTVTATGSEGDGSVTATGLVTMNVTEPGVRLATALGPFPAGSEIALSRIDGGDVVEPHMGACEAFHLHSFGGGIRIDGQGPFPDPNQTGCGYGVMIRVPVE
ncbi:MAG TPA: hypothetical protein VK928_11590 [Longimicrobiales bacterium]|nr:hypothetical protein [Longimicrobiales bacterium]